MPLCFLQRQISLNRPIASVVKIKPDNFVLFHRFLPYD